MLLEPVSSAFDLLTVYLPIVAAKQFIVFLFKEVPCRKRDAYRLHAYIVTALGKQLHRYMPRVLHLKQWSSLTF